MDQDNNRDLHKRQQRIKVSNLKQPGSTAVLVWDPQSDRWFKMGQMHYGIEEHRIKEFWKIEGYL